MFRTIYYKFVGVLLVIFCLIVVFYVFWTLFVTRLYMKEANQRLNQNLAEHIADHEILMEGGRIDEKTLKNVFHMLMVVNPSIELYLLDPEGNILTYSAPAGKVQRKKVSLEPVKVFLSENTSYPILGDDPRNPKGKKVFSATPIMENDQLMGYLYIILASEEYDSVRHILQTSYVLRLSLWWVGGALLFTLLASLFVFKRLTRPLRNLASAMESFEKSRFSKHPDKTYPADPETGDEIHRLGFVFNQMATEIQAQIGKLKFTDSRRRDLVANISHDLQSPLASLQGYLETLLMKEKDLTPEERRDYISNAIDLSGQLSNLIEELLELAKLESPEMKPNLEPLFLSDLIQDVALKFRIAGEKMGISLETEIPENVPFVLADIGLVERVLSNLIENALRFTSEGGRIILGLLPAADHVTVQVRDTGCGISQENLSRIFDRFYVAEEKRRVGAGGTGLGLAIVRRIVELHGSTIEVESTVNVGATFSFDLHVYRK